jgi:hypothetical protein
VPGSTLAGSLIAAQPVFNCEASDGRDAASKTLITKMLMLFVERQYSTRISPDGAQASDSMDAMEYAEKIRCLGVASHFRMRN